MTGAGAPSHAQVGEGAEAWWGRAGPGFFLGRDTEGRGVGKPQTQILVVDWSRGVPSPFKYLGPRFGVFVSLVAVFNLL